MSTKKILLVCMGNICRSPMAEGILRHKTLERLMSVETDSAGTINNHVGESPDPRAQRCMRDHGIDISDLPQDVMADMVRGRQPSSGEAAMSLKRIQRALILETLRETGGNFRRTSSLLNISRTTLYAKLKQYGITADSFRAPA